MDTTLEREKEIVYPFYKSELDARKNCIESILNELIEKMKMSMLLPRFFDEYVEVYKRLKDTPYIFQAKDLRAYCKNNDPALATEKVNYRHRELLHVIDQFQKHHEILKFFPDWVGELSTAQCAAIAEIALLKDIAKQRFHMQARAQAEDEQKLHVIFLENMKVRRGLQTMARLLLKNRNSLRWRIAARESVFLEMESELNAQNERIEEILVEEQKKANLRINPRQFKQREAEAEEELHQAEVNLERTCHTNLKNEAIARADRNKYLIQYQALLKKFDQVMLDKFRENMNVDEEAVIVKAEHAKFMRVYQRAEKVYDAIIRAKEVEKERARLAKIKMFISNRSARVIQRWYRQILRDTERGHLVYEKTIKKKGKGKKAK